MIISTIFLTFTAIVLSSPICLNTLETYITNNMDPDQTALCTKFSNSRYAMPSAIRKLISLHYNKQTLHPAKFINPTLFLTFTAIDVSSPICLNTYKLEFRDTYKLEFREPDVSPGKTEVKQGKFVEFIFPVKDYFRETYKSQNINFISPSPKFTLGIIQIEVKRLSTSFSVSSIKN